MKRMFKSWAIDTHTKEGHGFIGQYWWFGGSAPMIPIHMLGTGTALFRTRQDARNYLPDVKSAFPKACVVRVNISIAT